MPTYRNYASKTLTDDTLKKLLKKEIFEQFCQVQYGAPMSLDVADEIARAMKCWAVKQGATHFTHWFQPLNGASAQKQECIFPLHGEIDGFCGKNLIKGEPDASSFPSGGLRSSFEARGYTVWDCTSPAFVKDGTLYIPTAFCSFTGEALDEKTPLLRSIDAINRQGLRLLKVFGINAKKIDVNVGIEQEYFLIDKVMFSKRKDLLYTGRTLVGAKPPKGQTMQTHYLGAVSQRAQAFMKDLDFALWQIGIPSKTRHMEASPRQYEFAPSFAPVNIACDQNQMAMETMKIIAQKHGFACVLHEKPFEYVNGSGKHNNWSLSADGHNLFECGTNPQNDALFLLALCSVISGADKHQDLLRISCANASNDLRLGGNEAPSCIISVYLGNEINGILQAIADGRSYSKRAKCAIDVGVKTLPKIPADNADRNRTSPLAFTGNKFEFRMGGASQNASFINTVLNTVVAEQFELYANLLEVAYDKNACVCDIVKECMRKHSRILFDGNNYSQKWAREANDKGLLNLKSTPCAIEYFLTDKTVKLFERQKVLSKKELASRQNIEFDRYCKSVSIEAETLLEIANTQILPCATNYKLTLAKTVAICASIGEIAAPESKILRALSQMENALLEHVETLQKEITFANEICDVKERAFYCLNNIRESMKSVRTACDACEKTIPSTLWDMPTYEQLFSSI